MASKTELVNEFEILQSLIGKESSTSTQPLRIAVIGQSNVLAERFGSWHCLIQAMQAFLGELGDLKIDYLVIPKSELEFEVQAISTLEIEVVHKVNVPLAKAGLVLRSFNACLKILYNKRLKAALRNLR